MNEAQRQRYSRHMMLAQFGVGGQRRLLESRVFIVGMGGLGSPTAMYLAASGIGHLVIADFDQVELSNLQRQIVHTTDAVGRLKVDSAKDTLGALNPDVKVSTLAFAPDDDDLARQIANADVVVDATDNFETRHAMNRICWQTVTPLVSGAAVRMEGLVSVFDPRDPQSPCYRCLYSEQSIEGEVCAQVGVLSPLLGVIGSVQAAETLKLLLGTGTSLAGRVLMLDAFDMQWQSLRLHKDPACPVCGEGASQSAAKALS